MQHPRRRPTSCQPAWLRSGDATRDITNAPSRVRRRRLASLAPKAKTTYKVVAKGIKAGDIRFKVQLTGDQTKVPVEETEGTNIYE